jgi:hypothetical protein
MKTFQEWLSEGAADDIRHAFDGIGGGVGPAADKKAEEYAKRIIGGETPEDVLQGLKQGGAIWNSVMSKVEELKGSGRVVRLSDLAGGVDDTDWHRLYEIFARQHSRHPQDPSVTELGVALYQSAKTGDYGILDSFKRKYIWAQPLR